MYKSAQPQQSKENDASASTTQELASNENSPSELQSLLAHPVAAECEFFQERSSPNFTAGLQRVPPSTGSVGLGRLTGDHVTLAVSHEMSDNAASLAGDYHRFRSSDSATEVLHQALDSTFQPGSKSKDLLPHYLTQHSFPTANGPCFRPVPASSAVANTVQTLSESVNDSANVHSQIEFRAAFVHGGMSDEAVHIYGNISA